MKIDPRQVHFITIGYHNIYDYFIQREIIRRNWPEGNKVWYTLVFNGHMDAMPTGIGENTFLRVEENRGYALGPFDMYNKGLEWAQNVPRSFIIVCNFDVWFLTWEGLELAIGDLVDSGKGFMTGKHGTHKFPMTDLMIFQKDFLGGVLPMEEKVLQERLDDPFLQKHYEERGFNQMEEHTMWSLAKAGNLDDNWCEMDRGEFPNYRWSEKYKVCHEHDVNVKIDLLNRFGIQGEYVNYFKTKGTQ